MSKTIIISNRLPVKILRKENSLGFKPSEGGLATGLGSIYKEGNNLWLGWPGMFIDKKEEQNFVTEELRKESMHPVFLSKREIRDFYEGFSNATLWPTFHYFNQYAIYKKSWWDAYQRVNQKFCQVVFEIAEPGDRIWVHDYQLLLLPQMLRQKIDNCLIGFFQHIPFSSYEVFRLLPWRKSILQGMLGADLIGFHTYDDARHFLSSVNRLVGISDTNGQLEIGDRYALVDAFPMGIDYKKYASAAISEETQQNEKIFRKSLGNQKLVLSIDRLDYSKGIPQKLLAFEQLLEKKPELQGSISLVMIVVPSRHHVQRYRELKEEIDELSGRINSRFSTIEWRPIHYFYRAFPLDQLSALYHMADIALITPMRDGMNLVAKEYVASKTDQKGVLILSEMAGASKELSDAIIINPNDADEMVQALERAIVMPEDEQRNHMQRMQHMVKLYDIHNWVELFIDRLNYIYEKQKSYATKPLNETAVREISERYGKSAKCLFVFDLDETFVPSGEFPLPRRLDEETFQVIKELSEVEKNKVVCVTGTDSETAERWFDGLRVDLIAEHGIWNKSYGESWNALENISSEWKYDIFPVLEHFVKRTPGSFIEEKDFSLVWHYRKVETGLGEIRTRELSEHLKYLVSNMNLNVIEGNMTMEIKSSLINKGRAVRRWLEQNAPDFIFAFGSINTSEDIFKALPVNAFKVKLGRGHSTNANYHILKKDEIFDLFRMLAFTKAFNLN